jgi:NAD-dependent DNA ligase
MISKRVTGAGVMARWGIDEVTLGDCVLYQGLNAYDKNMHLINIQKEIARLKQSESDETLFTIYCWIGYDINDISDVTYFKIEDIEAFERKYSEILSLQAPSATAETDKPEEGTHTVPNEALSKIGSKGGQVSKIKQPILQALVQFLKANPNRIRKSAKAICTSFINAVGKGIAIKVDGKDYEVNYADGEIYYAKSRGNGKLKETSIKSSTFKKTYVALAKKEIEEGNQSPST